MAPLWGLATDGHGSCAHVLFARALADAILGWETDSISYSFSKQRKNVASAKKEIQNPTSTKLSPTSFATVLKTNYLFAEAYRDRPDPQTSTKE